MKYNLSCNISNFSGAEKILSEDELSSLVDGEVYGSSLPITSGETATILCDLNNRYNLSYLNYYYSGDGEIDISVAESEGVWSSVNLTTISGGLLRSNFTDYSPRWLKIVHSVTAGSGNMCEVEVYNSDSNMLFGPDGTYSAYGMDSSGVGIDPVAVYNSTDSTKDFKVFVGEGIDTEADNLLSVGLSTSGTFYSKREYGLNLPTDFVWDSGKHEGTVSSPDYLTLSGTSTSGTYYSPVFNSQAYPDSRVFFDYILEGDGYVDFRGLNDSSSTVGLRRHNHAPTGGWSDGLLPDEDDLVWSTSSGSLSFYPVKNNTIVDLSTNYFVQFCISISGSLPSTPYVKKMGIESALSVGSVRPNSYVNVYVSSISGTVGNKTANLICWYRE